MGESRIRVVRSRGRSYLQEVTYEWDPIQKRGITRVLRHLGPEQPVNSERHRDWELVQGRARLWRERDRRARQGLIRDGKTPPDPPSARSDPAVPSRGPRRQVLTPSPNLITMVRESLGRLPKGGSRKEVAADLEARGLLPGDRIIEARTQVGFALTILARRGDLELQGLGERGNPQVFSLKGPTVTHSSTIAGQ